MKSELLRGDKVSMGGGGVIDSIVSISDLYKCYGKNSIFEGLNLTLRGGSFYALLGKNGSGKSTLIRILAHREATSAGEGGVLGVSFDRDFGELANRIAYVSETTHLPNDQSVAGLISLHSELYRSWDSNVTEALLVGFRLDVNRTIGQLSRGQLVQAALVLSLSYSPTLILLDEVTAVLDVRARNFLMEHLRSRVAVGATVLLATNIVTEVQDVADSIILIGEKRVTINSKIKELSQHFIKVIRRKDADFPLLPKDSCVEVGFSVIGDVHYLIAKSDSAAALITPNLLSAEPITPAEIFLFLTRQRD